MRLRQREREGLKEEQYEWCFERLVVIRRAQTTKEAVEDLLWVAFAIVIVYLGDCQATLLSILLWDPRINRTTLLLGLFGLSLNIGIILYNLLFSYGTRLKFHEKHEPSDVQVEASTSTDDDKPQVFLKITLPLLLIGISTFCLLLYALWPIWSFLGILLLLSLLMSSIAILPYLLGAVTKAQILAF